MILLQRYVDSPDRPGSQATTNEPLSPILVSKSLDAPQSRKRKEPGGDVEGATETGLPTPADSSRPSPFGAIDTLPNADVGDEHQSFNGYLDRRAGWFVPKTDSYLPFDSVDADSLPTSQMVEAAKNIGVREAKTAIREAFVEKLKSSNVRRVTLRNTIDDTTPSLDFRFINEFVLGEGTCRADPETTVGCLPDCKPNNSKDMGCDSGRLCTCLEYADVDEQALQSEDPMEYAAYMQEKQLLGEVVDKAGLPKRFPYRRAKSQHGEHISTLVPFYRSSRHAIYECNHACPCGSDCKTRVVQKGRKVALTIFKTLDRGWGIYCNEDLKPGEFVDIYLGEIITSKEADRREEETGPSKSSYLYTLDKFVGADPELTIQNCFVIDGQSMGNVTRFFNHSCEPNLGQYTVSRNKNDFRVYDQAFFARRFIPAGKELTFDYADKDEVDEEEAVKRREMVLSDPDNADLTRCKCGATKCRGILWS